MWLPLILALLLVALAATVPYPSPDAEQLLYRLKFVAYGLMVIAYATMLYVYSTGLGT